MNAAHLSDYTEYISAISGISFQFDLVLRMLASMLAGAIIGFERKRRQKEAGIRTHCMVAIGAALFAIVSKYGYLDIVWIDGISADASRIAANIVTGVSFLGAGMIFVRSKSIRGLTTAAGIWSVSAVGLAFGTGMYCIGIFTTILIVLIQFVLYKPLLKLEGASSKEFNCHVTHASEHLEELIGVIKDIDPAMSINHLEKSDDDSVHISFSVRETSNCILEDLYSFMQQYPYVKAISR